MLAAWLISSINFLALLGQTQEFGRPALWVDALRGEPISMPDMLSELARVRIIYAGEYHSIPRHHQLEKELLDGLVAQGARLVLAMEQFESFMQPELDRYNSGTIGLDAFVQQSQWAKRWPGYTNYLPVLTAAKQHQVPVLALNARAETIRATGRTGINGLSPEQRRELPLDLVIDDPIYQRLLNQNLAVHMAFDPKKLQPIYEAQVARDEFMAARLAEYLQSPNGQGRIALVICGRGHCEFGLGTPARVARRIPAVTQRIVLLSESGDLHLTEEERKQARDIEITHSFLREVGRPPGDYFHIVQPAGSVQ
jgi:uncharacterized iron-regulated protein